MRKYMIAALLVFVAHATSAFAQQPAKEFSELSSDPGRVTLTNSASIGAIVKAIDAPSRKLTLKLANDREVDFVAGPEIRNFDQIKVGDELRAEYMRIIVLNRKPGGKPLKGEEQIDMARAKQGQKPGGMITYKARMLTDVVDVNKKRGTITLKDPTGNIAILNVKNPAQYDAVKVGNQVEIDYVESLSIAMTAPGSTGSMK